MVCLLALMVMLPCLRSRIHFNNLHLQSVVLCACDMVCTGTRTKVTLYTSTFGLATQRTDQREASTINTAEMRYGFHTIVFERRA